MAAMTLMAAASVVRAVHGMAIDGIRAQFPALASDTIFLENAGGSQVPRCVADATRDYMLESYVNLAAGYAKSDIATRTVGQAHDFINLLMNGQNVGKVILGPSSTQLVYMLASCYADVLTPGDEIVVAQTGHEANIGPWMRLAERMPGLKVRMWAVERDSMSCRLEDLQSLLTTRTRLVTFPHVSNLLGEIIDVEAVTRMAHAAGARVVVDGVAYAPHRAMDVARWGVDWYFYSTYKVYGPHMGAMFGRDDAIAQLTGPNHFFIPREQVPYKFEVGGASHEGCAGLLALRGYLNVLAGEEPLRTMDRATIEAAFEIMTNCELPLQRRLIDWLRSRSDVRIIGPAHGEATRIATISFLHDRLSPRKVAEPALERNIGLRTGHMYAYRLCEGLGIGVREGVVRVSAVHYNTVDEIDRLIAAVDPVLSMGA